MIRKNLGFQCFYIGRDHAGAENLYKNLSAIKAAKKYKNKFSIKILTSKGGYYCKICDKYLIKDSCRHKKLTNVSGTEFRKCLNRKFLYVHADTEEGPAEILEISSKLYAQELYNYNDKVSEWLDSQE